MAKKHKNLENIPIRWNGKLSHPDAGNQGQSIPTSVNLGTWGDIITTTVVPEHIPVWEASGCVLGDSSKCADGTMDDPVYFEDYNIYCATENNWNYLIDSCSDTEISSLTGTLWGVLLGRSDIQTEINAFIASGDMPDNAPEASTTTSTTISTTKTKYTWGDVNFVIEIADGIGTGNRRAREARIQQFDKDKKKRLIRLICRVKGEKVYDEEKEVGDTYIKLEDAELVINEVLGKIKVEKADVL